jgi:hypothetical protein
MVMWVVFWAPAMSAPVKFVLLFIFTELWKRLLEFRPVWNELFILPRAVKEFLSKPR